MEVRRSRRPVRARPSAATGLWMTPHRARERALVGRRGRHAAHILKYNASRHVPPEEPAMPVPEPLDAERLLARCDPDDLRWPVAGAADHRADGLGQERAVEALRFGIGMKRHGYNVFAYGARRRHGHRHLRHRSRKAERCGNPQRCPPASHGLSAGDREPRYRRGKHRQPRRPACRAGDQRARPRQARDGREAGRADACRCRTRAARPAGQRHAAHIEPDLAPVPPFQGAEVMD